MNRESYNKIAREWSDARRSFFGRERKYLDTVLEAAPEGAMILDLGCGTGGPMADYVVSRGRHVIGVDQSEAMLDSTKASLPREPWVLAPIEAYEIRSEYAGVLIWDSLFHTHRRRPNRFCMAWAAGCCVPSS